MLVTEVARKIEYCLVYNTNTSCGAFVGLKPVYIEYEGKCKGCSKKQYHFTTVHNYRKIQDVEEEIAYSGANFCSNTPYKDTDVFVQKQTRQI